MIFVNSTNEPGQPCVMSSGKAFGSFDLRWMKWIVSPSIVVVNWSNPFSFRSWARQSNVSRQ